MADAESEARALVLLLWAAPWILGSIFVMVAGRRRGHGGAEALLVSLFLSPLFGILYVAALPDRSREFDREEAARRAEAERAAARREMRSCDACGFIGNHPFQGKCPECGVPRGRGQG